MTRDTRLSQDLAALAAVERQRLGEPPAREQLIALRDGELSPEEADLIRDQLTLDPELASAYLELTRDSEAEAQPTDDPDDLLEVDVDDAWRRLSPRLDRETGQRVTDAAYDDAESVVSFPRRGWPPFLGLAATLTFALGLVWILGDRGAKPPISPDYEEIAIKDLLRNPNRTIPNGATGIAFQIDASELDPGTYIVELLDATGEQVQEQRMPVGSEQRPLVFAVALESLESNRSYQLIVRLSDTSPTESPLIDIAIRPIFDSPPKAGSQASALGSCEKLSSEITRIKQLRLDSKRQAAETAYYQALDAALAGGCWLEEARVWNGLAALTALEGRLFDALRLLDRAMDALDSLKDVDRAEKGPLKAKIEFNRAAIHLRLHWLDEAEKGFHKARASYRLLAAGPNRQGKLSLQLARVYRLQGEVDRARTMVEEALAFPIADSLLRASLWQESAWIEFENDRLEAAERALEKGIEILGDGDTYAKANLLVDMAELRSRQGRWAESLRWADKTLALAEAADKPDFNLETTARHVRSVALNGLGEYDDAKRSADRGLVLLEALREVWRDQGLLFFALRKKFYDHRLDLAMAAGNPEDAWKVFEGYRAQSLLENTTERVQRPKNRRDDEHSGKAELKRRDLLDAIRQLEHSLPSDEDPVYRYRETRVLEHRLELRALQNAERQSAGFDPLPEVDPQAAADLLGADSLGLAFASGTDQFHTLALTRHRNLEGHSLETDRDRIHTLTAEILEGLDPRAAGKTLKGHETRVRELSRILLTPFKDQLDDFRRLVIVAEAPLDKVPFGILRHPETGRYLIESHEITYLPSFSALEALRRRSGKCTPPRPGIFVMADPVFGSRDLRWPATASDPRSAEDVLAFQRLPGTDAEATRIAQHYGVKPIVGPEATRERFLAEAHTHRVIHVASHADGDSRIPERSKIALSCIDTEGLVPEFCDLYFDDVLTLELCGQTVVLSACKTAGGFSVEGEGILGLPWAFLRAGASSVVASQWQVADKATTQLMSVFHRHLRGGMAPANALRQAKIALIQGNHPASAWAPFILLGDWDASTFLKRSGPIDQTD